MAHIVIGVDGSPEADAALRWAVEEAELRSASVELLLAYVVEVHRGVAASGRAVAERTLHHTIDRNADVLAAAKWESSLAPVTGGPFSTALARAGGDATLLVLGSRGREGFRGLLLGSTSYRTAGRAQCPVAVVRGTGTGTPRGQPVVVGFDDSPAAARALQWAVDEAALRDVDVVAVHGYVCPPLPVPGMAEPDPALERERRELRVRAEALADHVLVRVDVPAGVAVRREVMPGSAAGALLHHAADGDRLVVVGSRGHGAVGRALLGSVSHQVLHHAAGPVVVVP